jgi:hypothetical protein
MARPMTSPQTLFFWSSNVSEPKVAVGQPLVLEEYLSEYFQQIIGRCQDRTELCQGFGGSIGVFTGTEEKEKGKNDNVSICLLERAVAVLSNEGNAPDHLNANRFDPIWRRVFFFPCFDHSLQCKVNITSGV